MQSYAAKGRFDPEDYAGRIAAIFSEGRIVGRGRATEEAAERLARGVSWEEAGASPPSAGNGSAMRAGPVGLFFYDDFGGLAEAARQQGIITHRDTRCSAGAIAIAGAVALALREEPIEGLDFLGRLSELTVRVEASFAEALMSLSGWIGLPPEEAVIHILRVGLEGDLEDGWGGISPFVVPSVLWSLYSFLRSPEDHRQTIAHRDSRRRRRGHHRSNGWGDQRSAPRPLSNPRSSCPAAHGSGVLGPVGADGPRRRVLRGKIP